MIESIIELSYMTQLGQVTHMHEKVELIYILEGAFQITVQSDSYRLQEKDMIVVNSNKSHAVESVSDNGLAVSFHINHDMLETKFSLAHTFFWCNSVVDKNDAYDRLREVLDTIIFNYSDRDGVGGLFLNSLYYRVIYTLVSHFTVNRDEMTLNPTGVPTTSRIMDIQDFIQKNFRRTIRLKDLADQLYLSNAYLSKYIKKHLGMSFLEYLNHIRLLYALDEIVHTEKKIIKIALDNGFATTAAFNKAFRDAYGETPSQYRKTIKKSHTDSEQVNQLQQIGQHKIEDYVTAHKKKKDAHEVAQAYDVMQVESYTKPWKELLNVGNAASLLQSDVQKHIRLLQESIGFKYIRFYNIFQKSMFRKSEEKGITYNFSHLDRIIDFLLEEDLIPFFEMGLKPYQVLSSEEVSIHTEEEKIEYDNLDEFKGIIQSMLHHMVNRYGLEVVEKWRFEFWADPRLTIENSGGYYYKCFDIIYKTVKEVSEHIPVGGPGFILGYDNYTCKEVLRSWKLRTIQPDFISVYGYRYTTVKEEGLFHSKRSIDSGFIRNQLEQLKETLISYGMEEKEIIVSEWNFTISNRNILNDSCGQGAYIVQNCIKNYGDLSMMGYWHATDVYSELYDSSKLLYGDSGLISHDGIKKNAFYAFAFLNRLYDGLVGRTDQYLITSNEKDSYRVICHNNKALSVNYLTQNEHHIDMENMYTQYADLDKQAMTIRLNHIKNGTYRIRRQIIGKEAGNVQHTWNTIGQIDALSKEEIHYLKQVSIPKLAIEYKQVKDECLELEMVMDAHEVQLIEIDYYREGYRT